MSEMYLYNNIGLPFAGTDLFCSLLLICPLVFMFVVKYGKTGNSAVAANFSSAVFFVHPLFSVATGIFFGELQSWNIFILVSILSSVAACVLLFVNKKLIRIL
jgi:hypothetical protein